MRERWRNGGKEEYYNLLREFKEAQAEAKKNGRSFPGKRPYLHYDPNGHHAPSTLYNAMINPLTGFEVKGVLWYQGEANAPRAWQYQHLLSSLFKDWRKQWENPRLPFIVIQLTGLGGIKRTSRLDSAWAELRQAQTNATKNDSNAYLVVTIDMGDPHCIHAPRKGPVGRRAALMALRHIYDNGVSKERLTPISVKTGNNRIVLEFSKKLAPLETHPQDSEVKDLFICGKDGVFKRASVELSGSTLTARRNGMDNPIAARYAWGKNSDGNLFFADGTPVPPFKTDEFPWTTRTKLFDDFKY
jgi:sialate O-acetylesterase